MLSGRATSSESRTKQRQPAFNQLRDFLSRKRLSRPFELTEDHIQSMLMLRRGREEIFGRSLFSDPAWDIMLELFSAHLTNRMLSIAELVTTTGTSEATLVRWLDALEEHDIVVWNRIGSDPHQQCVCLRTDAGARMKQLIDHWVSAFFSI